MDTTTSATADAMIAESVTERQQEVLVGLAQRLTIKEIAASMEVSESAINQHIKALKLRLKANSLRELVDWWQSSNCSISTARNQQLPDTFEFPNSSLQDESLGLIEFGDSMTINRDAPWNIDQPTFFRRMLDGRYSLLTRSAAIVIIAVGLMVAMAATFSVMVSLTYLESENAAVPAESNDATPS